MNVMIIIIQAIGDWGEEVEKLEVVLVLDFEEHISNKNNKEGNKIK
jgi:hypothetical protein